MNLYISPAVASAVRVCIDSHNSSGWNGRIYTRLDEKPIGFRNMDEMLNILGAFYDCIQFPQASTMNRNFTETPAAWPEQSRKTVFQVFYPEDRVKDKIKVKVSEEEMDKKHGEQGTFLVRIQYRQNATWQGHVTWVEENKTVPFRSALELIKLIDGTQREVTEDWEKDR